MTQTTQLVSQLRMKDDERYPKPRPPGSPLLAPVWTPPVTDSNSPNPYLVPVLAGSVVMLFSLGVTGLVVTVSDLSSYGTRLQILTEDMATLKTITQGLDGSLRPDGTLSAEMGELKRDQATTNDQLKELIEALGRSRQGLPTKP